MSERIGFVGLGIMGKPMAKNLVEAGYDLTVYNRSSKAVSELVQQGAQAGVSSADVASKSDITILMVPDSPDSKAVVLGENGLLEGATGGDLIIDMSSIEPGVSREIHDRCNEKQNKDAQELFFGKLPHIKFLNLLFVLNVVPKIYSEYFIV